MDETQLVKGMATLAANQTADERRYTGTVRAKVVAQRTSGGKVDLDHPRYAVDVQPLTKDGAVDDGWPVIPDVPLLVGWAGPRCGVYALPPVGAVVRLGFDYADPSHPYIGGILGDGFEVDAAPGAAFVIQSGDTRLSVETNGLISISGKEVKLGQGVGTLARVTPLVDWLNTHTHPTPAGPSSAPTVVVAAGALESQGVKA